MKLFAILEVGGRGGEYSELEQCRCLMWPTTPQALRLDFQIVFVFDLAWVFLYTLYRVFFLTGTPLKS